MSRGLLLIVVVVGLLWHTSAEANTKVALVTNGGDGNASDVLAVAQAKLGADTQVELLDRQHIERVLQEQRLSFSGLVDAAKVLNAGKLLAIDLFAVVESESKENPSLALVVFDARSGARLFDSALRETNTEKLADAVAAGVRASEQKLRRRQNRINTVGLLSCRNADWPRGKDSVFNAIGLLVERELTASPDLSVLERTRLSQVNRERELASNAGDSRLLASTALLDLEFSRRGVLDQLKVTVSLTSMAGEALGMTEVKFDKIDAPETAKALARRVIELLKATPSSGDATRDIEGQRFFEEANLLLAHKDPEALARAEAAYALSPTNTAYESTLAVCLMAHANHLLVADRRGRNGVPRNVTNRASSADLVELVVAEAKRSLATRCTLGTEDRFSWPLNFRHCGSVEFQLSKLWEAGDSSSRGIINEFYAAYRSYCLDRIEMWSQAVENAPSLLSEYTRAFGLSMTMLSHCAPKQTDSRAEVTIAVERWLGLIDKYGPPDGIWFNNVFHHLLFFSDYEKAFKAMEQHPYPVIRIYGAAGKALYRQRFEERTNAARYNTRQQQLIPVYEKLKEGAMQIIADPKPWPADVTRAHAYLSISAVITNFWISDSFIVRERLAWCNYMLDRNEMAVSLVHYVFHSLDLLNAESAAAYFALATRIKTVCESDKCRLIEGDVERLKGYLQRWQDTILSKYPEVAKPTTNAPWRSASKLFDVSQIEGIRQIINPIIAGANIYAIGLGSDSHTNFLQLISIPLQGGKPVLLSKAPYAGVVSREIPVLERRSQFSLQACLYNQKVVVGTFGHGLYVFPTDGAAAEHITVNEGLPSDYIKSVACMGGKIYCGAGFVDDGYLVSIDLKTKQTQILASSRRKIEQSPFDNNTPFNIYHMVSDESGKRLVFLVGSTFWQLDQDRKYTVLGSYHPEEPSQSRDRSWRFDWGSPVRQDHVLLGLLRGAAVFDLKLNKAQTLSLAKPDAILPGAPYLIHDGWLWCASPFSRISLTDKRFERLPSPSNEIVYDNYCPTECIEAIDANQLLIGNRQTIWLLKLRSN